MVPGIKYPKVSVFTLRLKKKSVYIATMELYQPGIEHEPAVCDALAVTPKVGFVSKLSLYSLFLSFYLMGNSDIPFNGNLHTLHIMSC